jgi:hypothetical protein
MGADQQAGLMRADLTGWRTRMHYLVTKGIETQPLRLASTDRTYRGAPGVR